VKIDAPDKPVKLGEKIQAKIIAKYYFGAPVTEAKVHYKVERTKKDSRWYPVARWDWLYSPGYWWFAPEYSWYPGFKTWGCLAPIRPWWNWSPDPPEVVVEGDAEIGPTEHSLSTSIRRPLWPAIATAITVMQSLPKLLTSLAAPSSATAACWWLVNRSKSLPGQIEDTIKRATPSTQVFRLARLMANL
jgi:hypothetical protein